MKTKSFTIKLESSDLFQVLDGLASRADSWASTAAYLRTGAYEESEPFLIEECSDPEEADEIAEHYRAIIRSIERQMNQQ